MAEDPQGQTPQEPTPGGMGAQPLPTLKDTVLDPKFHALVPEARRIVLSQIDKGFAGADKESQDYIIHRPYDQWVNEFREPGLMERTWGATKAAVGRIGELAQQAYGGGLPPPPPDQTTKFTPAKLPKNLPGAIPDPNETESLWTKADRYANIYGVDPAINRAIIMSESGGNSHAKVMDSNKQYSRGLYQWNGSGYGKDVPDQLAYDPDYVIPKSLEYIKPVYDAGVAMGLKDKDLLLYIGENAQKYDPKSGDKRYASVWDALQAGQQLPQRLIAAQLQSDKSTPQTLPTSLVDKEVPGLLEPGNIDLTKRPVVTNPDGTRSTVRSISVGINGEEILIPTVSDDGHIMTNEEAVDAYKRTGRHLGIFDSPQSATSYAQTLHDDYASGKIPGYENKDPHVANDTAWYDHPFLKISGAVSKIVDADVARGPRQVVGLNGVVYTAPPPPPFIVGGVKAMGELAEQMTTPKNIVLMVALRKIPMAPFLKIAASFGLSVPMLYGAIQDSQEAWDAAKKGDYEGLGNAVTKALANATFGSAILAGGIKTTSEWMGIIKDYVAGKKTAQTSRFENAKKVNEAGKGPTPPAQAGTSADLDKKALPPGPTGSGGEPASIPEPGTPAPPGGDLPDTDATFKERLASAESKKGAPLSPEEIDKIRGQFNLDRVTKAQINAGKPRPAAAGKISSAKSGIPELQDRLDAAESKKGAPLSSDEVNAIRQKFNMDRITAAQGRAGLGSVDVDALKAQEEQRLGRPLTPIEQATVEQNAYGTEAQTQIETQVEPKSGELKAPPTEETPAAVPGGESGGVLDKAPPEGEPEGVSPAQSEELLRGSSDPLPLNQNGIGQATDIGDYFHRNGGLDGIFSSDLQRTAQTATILSDATNAPILDMSEDLQPWRSGGFEGQQTSLVIDKLHDYMLNRPDEPVPGQGPSSTKPGESFNDFKNRFLGYMQIVLGTAHDNPEKKFAVVGSFRNAKLLEAWIKAGANGETLDIDKGEMQKKDGEPGSVYWLGFTPDGLKMERVGTHPENDAPLRPGVYFIRHGATNWNEGIPEIGAAAAPAQPTSELPAPPPDLTPAQADTGLSSKLGPEPQSYDDAQKAVDAYEDQLASKYGEASLTLMPHEKSPFTREESSILEGLYQRRYAFENAETEQFVQETSNKLEPLIPDQAERMKFARKITQADIPTSLRTDASPEAWKGVGQLANEIVHHLSEKLGDPPQTAFSIRAKIAGTADEPKIQLAMSSEAGLGPSQRVLDEAQKWMNHLFADAAHIPKIPGARTAIKRESLPEPPGKTSGFSRLRIRGMAQRQHQDLDHIARRLYGKPFDGLSNDEINTIGKNLERSGGRAPVPTHGIPPPPEVTVPEEQATFSTQLKALNKGRRRVVFIPNDPTVDIDNFSQSIIDRSGVDPDTIGAIDIEGKGRYLYDPKAISAEDIRTAAQNNTDFSLMGILEPKSEMTTVGVRAEVPKQNGGWTEAATAIVSPGNQEAQTEEFQDQFDDQNARIVTGPAESIAAGTIAEREGLPQPPPEDIEVVPPRKERKPSEQRDRTAKNIPSGGVSGEAGGPTPAGVSGEVREAEPSGGPDTAVPTEQPAERPAPRPVKKPDIGELSKGSRYSLRGRDPIVLSKQERRDINARVIDLVQTKQPGDPLTDEEKDLLRKYTGSGGLGDTEKERGLLYEHYTSYRMVEWTWDKLRAMGFPVEDIKMMDPAFGIGNFGGFAHPSVQIFGTEIDEIAVKVARLLYPDAKVSNLPFEEYAPRRDIDLFISNVPFNAHRGALKYSDEAKEYEDIKALHDFFFMKSLDMARPNGMVAYFTSIGTMDGTGVDKVETRKEMNRRGEFLGAYRTPNGEFSKNTHYEGSTDVIFFRKRTPEEMANWTDTMYQEEFIHALNPKDEGNPTKGKLSSWYVKHPEKAWGTLKSGLGLYEEQVGVEHFKGADGKRDAARYDRVMHGALKDEIRYVPVKITASTREDKEESERPILGERPEGMKTGTIVWDAEKEKFGYAAKDGNIYEASEMPRKRKGGEDKNKTFNRVQRGLRLMELTDELYSALRENDIDRADQLRELIRPTLEKYKKDYATAKSNPSGAPGTDPALWKYLNGGPASNPFPFADPRVWRLAGLTDRKGDPSDIFTKNTMYRPAPVPRSFDPTDAVDTAKFVYEETSVMDWDRFKSLYTGPGDQNDLVGHPDFSIEALDANALPVLQIDDEYLFGDIYPKIDETNTLYNEIESTHEDSTDKAKILEVLSKQLEKLQNALPEQADTDEVIRRSDPFSSYMQDRIVKTWVQNQFPGTWTVEKEFDPERGKFAWHVSGHFRLQMEVAGEIKDANGVPLPTQVVLDEEVVENYLNHRRPTKQIPTGQRDAKGREKMKTIFSEVGERTYKKLTDYFQTWARGNRSYFEDLTPIYNRMFRSFRERFYSPKQLNIPGLASTFKGKPLEIQSHQWEGVGRQAHMGAGIVSYGVGGGKTLVGILLAAHLKATGKVTKPMIVAPAKVVKNWAYEISQVLPDAKIADLSGMDADNRYRMLQRVAASDADYILISFESMKEIPLQKSEEYIREDIRLFEDRLHATMAAGGKSDAQRKKREQDIQNAVMRLEERLAQLQAFKKTKTVWFEDLGVDGIIIDEAHNYKNSPRSYGDMAEYVHEGKPAQRAADMVYKTRYIHERRGGKKGANVFGLTATPTPNHPSEIYAMMQYVAPEEWTSRGIMNAGDFIEQFGVIDTVEVKGATGVPTSKTVWTGYKNLKELRSIFRRYVDFRPIEMLPVQRPAAEYQDHKLEPTEAVTEAAGYIAWLDEFVKEDFRHAAELGINHLTVLTEARKVAADPAIFDPVKYGDSLGGPGSKLDSLINNVINLDTGDNCQLIFCDLYRGGYHEEEGDDLENQKISQGGEDDEDPEASKQKKGKFVELLNIHKHIKAKLIEAGIPESQIEIINQQSNSGAKAKFKVQQENAEGKNRFLIGTTQSMGEGMNLQTYTTDIHNYDVPWNPAGLEQRGGRGLRQGNTNDVVRIHRYLVKGTSDAKLYDILARKDRWNKELWMGDADEVTDFDSDGRNFQELADSAAIPQSTLDYYRAKHASTLAQAGIAELEKDIQQSEHAVVNHENRIKSWQDRITDYEKDIREGNGSAYYEQLLESLRNNVSDAQSRVKNYQDEIAKWRDRIESLGEEYSKAEAYVVLYEQAKRSGKSVEEVDAEAGIASSAPRKFLSGLQLKKAVPTVKRKVAKPPAGGLPGPPGGLKPPDMDVDALDTRVKDLTKQRDEAGNQGDFELYNQLSDQVLDAQRQLDERINNRLTPLPESKVAQPDEETEPKDAANEPEPDNKGPHYMYSGGPSTQQILGAVARTLGYTAGIGGRSPEEVLADLQTAMGQERRQLEEALRSFFVGDRDPSIVETNQLREMCRQMIPSVLDQQAVSLLREFGNRPGELQEFMDGTHPIFNKVARYFAQKNPKATPQEVTDARLRAIKAVRELRPVIERAMNPSPEMQQVADLQTAYFRRRLYEGRLLGFLQSNILPEDYLVHILTFDQEPSSGNAAPTNIKGHPMPRNFEFASKRTFPDLLTALAFSGETGARPATFNALDAMTIYGDRWAKVAATVKLIGLLKNNGVLKYGTRGDPDLKDWVPYTRGENALWDYHFAYDDKDTGEPRTAYRRAFGPKPIVEALRAITDPDYLRHLKGYTAIRVYQAMLKSVELGLSFFHMKALTATAIANMGPKEIKTIFEKGFSDTPTFKAGEVLGARYGLVTSMAGKAIEAYRGIRAEESPLADKLRTVPGIKQIDEAARGLTRFMFDHMQRIFKVHDFMLKDAAWIAKHPVEAQNPNRLAEARRSIAKEVNSAYGGLNWEVMGLNKMLVGAARLFFLAPDWTFSNVIQLKYAFEMAPPPAGGAPPPAGGAPPPGGTPPGGGPPNQPPGAGLPPPPDNPMGRLIESTPAGRAARWFWFRAFVFGILLSEFTSLMLTGKFSRHPTAVYAGKDKDGKDVFYKKTFFAGGPSDLIQAWDNVQDYGLVQGLLRSIANKMSPLSRTGMEALKNEDWAGRAIAQKGMPEPAASIRGLLHIAGGITPIPFSVTNLISMLTRGDQRYSIPEYIMETLMAIRATHEVPKGARVITSGPNKGRVVKASPKKERGVIDQILSGKVNAPARKSASASLPPPPSP
jgi:broad specificity phosphatase PhoE